MGRWALAVTMVAVVVAACGGSGGSNGSGDRAAHSSPGGACERGDDERLFDRYVVLMDPESGPQEILDVLQFGDDPDVIDYVTTYVASSQLYDNFFSFYFAAGGKIGRAHV